MLAKPGKAKNCLGNGAGNRLVDFGRRVVVTIDVPALLGFSKKDLVILAVEQANVVDLRLAWQEKLNCPGKNMGRVIAQDTRQRGVDLVGKVKPLE